MQSPHSYKWMGEPQQQTWQQQEQQQQQHFFPPTFSFVPEAP